MTSNSCPSCLVSLPPRYPSAVSCRCQHQPSFPVTAPSTFQSFSGGGSFPKGLAEFWGMTVMTGPKNSSQSRRARHAGHPRCCQQGKLLTSAQPGHLLCRKSRGLCWKSAFNLGFLFSALGDAQTGLSFKLLHTSFSKLSSQSKKAGGGEELGWLRRGPSLPRRP